MRVLKNLRNKMFLNGLLAKFVVFNGFPLALFLHGVFRHYNTRPPVSCHQQSINHRPFMRFASYTEPRPFVINVIGRPSIGCCGRLTRLVQVWACPTGMVAKAAPHVTGAPGKCIVTSLSTHPVHSRHMLATVAVSYTHLTLPTKRIV